MTDNINVEFIERCEKITRKYEEDNRWSINTQLLHIYLEVGETQKALQSHDMENCKEEICDIILTAITLFHKLDVTPKEIIESMEKTLDKVERRCGIKVY